MRTCPGCGDKKPLSAFAVNRYRRDGLNCYCRDCMRERRARYKEKQRAYDAARYLQKGDAIKARVRSYHADKRAGRKRSRPSWEETHADALAFREAHAEDLAQRARDEIADWRRRNPELVAAGHRRWYRRNREEILKRRAAWREANRERYVSGCRDRKGRRRAREAGGEVISPIDLQELGAEYGWVCHLCGREIENMSGTDQDSLSWDHVVPLALGGRHAVDNLAPAHLRCNLRRPRTRLDEAALARLQAVA